MAWLIGAVAWLVLALAVGSVIGRGIRIADAKAAEADVREGAAPDVDVIAGDVPPAGWPPVPRPPARAAGRAIGPFEHHPSARDSGLC
ncbi:MAG: hypothetical protein JWO98_4182 [Frankiales bacterium]|nr:hypothetical protein [Frankiales bacterium]